MGAAADTIIAALEPVQTSYPDGGTTSALVDALMTPVEVVHEVANETPAGGAAWSTLRDPDLTPTAFLGWLAQHAGVRLPVGISDAEKRDRIKQGAGLRRGRDAALITEIKRTLTGSQLVTLYKRIHGNPWVMTAITYAAQTPDPAATAAAALSQKIAGVRVSTLHRVDRGWSIGQMEAAYVGQHISDVETGFATINDLETRLPS